MTSPSFQLPDDIQGCHALIEQLRVELHAANERIAKLQSEADESRDAAARIGRLEDLLAQYQVFSMRRPCGSRRLETKAMVNCSSEVNAYH